jgi:processive 1,2-diacylglycerol beta-glucosyltransferase
MNLAQSLRDMLDNHYNVVITDPQPQKTEQFYTAVSRRFVHLLNWQYALTDHALTAYGLQCIVTRLGLKRCMSIIEQVQPQLIIATHALVSYLAARANEQSKKRVPLVFQFTDLGLLHKTWFIEKHADAYLAPTREIFAQTLTQGIAKNRVYLTGRPVRRLFLEASPVERENILANLHFDPDIFTIFLQGGAKGSAGVDRMIENVLATHLPVQIILAAGNNTELVARYEGTELVRVLPFTENIAPYMMAADVIAGKAGASSITEACILEKPFIATAFIPGQETPNLRFIEQHHLGWVCLEATAQKTLLSQLIRNQDRMAEKAASIRAYKSWNIQANQEIVPIIDRLLS